MASDASEAESSDGSSVEQDIESESEDEYQTHKIQFHDLLHDVSERIRSASENEGPASAVSKEAWNRRWRQIFGQIQRDVAADERYPTAITNPPVYELELRCADGPDAHGCPCGFDREFLPLVKIEVPRDRRQQPHGITKELLVGKICEALHGTEEAPGGLVGEADNKMTLIGIDWMISDGCVMYDTIFLYCEGLTGY